MVFMEKSPDFWNYIDELIRTSQILIDRPKGSRHPRYPDFIYPLDYGYLEGTSAIDGSGIDCYLGSLGPQLLDAILVSVDLFKRDVEIKLLLDCTETEKQLALNASNDETMHAMLIRRSLITEPINL